MKQLSPERQLQLQGIGRIERCRRCPRYRQLAEDPRAERGRSLAPVPHFCKHVVCGPPARRYVAALRIGDAKIA